MDEMEQWIHGPPLIIKNLSTLKLESSNLQIHKLLVVYSRLKFMFFTITTSYKNSENFQTRVFLHHV